MTSVNQNAQHFANMLRRGSMPPHGSLSDKMALAEVANVTYAVTVNGHPVYVKATVDGFDLVARGYAFTAFIPAGTFVALLWANCTFRKVDLEETDVVVSMGIVPDRTVDA
jgi:hypothetical protein